MATEAKQKCFVIMPFDKTTEEHTKEYWDNHYEKFLKPLIELGHPLEAECSTALRVDIIRKIITDLVMSPIVVADLTDSNPNVYWELGVRQSFKHRTITIAEDGTELPYDLHAKGTLFYCCKEYIKNQQFIDKFNKAINDCLENPHLPDSHVLETISGRGTLYQIISRGDTIRRLSAFHSEIKRNKRLLKTIKETCDKNIELRKKKEERIEYVTGRFRCPSVESLITNRYVDADEEFYKVTEEYFDDLLRFNDQLSIWEREAVDTEQWLVKVIGKFEELIAKLSELVVENKKAVEATL